MMYDLEIDKALEQINKYKAKLVCIQLPDGLKRYAGSIQDQIEEKTSAEVIIWSGSCFGACDVPNVPKADLLIQWGHSEWNY